MPRAVRTRTRENTPTRRATRNDLIVVKVAALGEEVRTVSVKNDATVFDAIESAFKHEIKEDRFDPEDGCEEIRVNNSTVSLDDKLQDGAVITLVADIDGG